MTAPFASLLATMVTLTVSTFAGIDASSSRRRFTDQQLFVTMHQ
jgi:hypothetical protein